MRKLIGATTQKKLNREPSEATWLEQPENAVHASDSLKRQV
jgi:hypothetical protein